MPEIVRILTDDQGTITHLVTDQQDNLSTMELAEHLDAGHDYYVTFGDYHRYTITMLAEEGHLEPTVDDPLGIRSIWDLPQDDDPAELEIEEMFERMNNIGEFDDGPIERGEYDREPMP